jgi:Domain of unknown function (DUF4438)
MTTTGPRLAAVEVNLLGIVEHPALADGPYRVNAAGRPYVPAGDGGIVLGVELGDPVFGRSADHAAPGACLVHSDPAARHALATYACIGNEAVVTTGGAAGARGAVTGKRGEQGRVIAGFGQDVLTAMRPGDQVRIRALGQGWRPSGCPDAVSVLNVAPELLPRLPVTVSETAVTAGVRLTVPSKLAGNGIGRPAVSWDLDLQLGPESDGAALRLGDLVAVSDIDARYNMGYRRGWVTVGVAVHGASPQPGHGPGITPMLAGPATVLRVLPDSAGHVGVTAAILAIGNG